MADYRVVTAALRKEASMWRARSAAAEPIVGAVRDTYLTSLAFFVGDPTTLATQELNATLQAEEYEEFRQFMESLLSGAVTEFDQIGATLVKIADEYDRAEAVIELDLEKTYHV